MNQVLVGGIALIIALILWDPRKKSKGSTFLKSQKDSFPKHNPTIAFVEKEKFTNQKEPENLENFQSEHFSHQHSLNSLATSKKLTKLFSGNPNDRLLAIQIASQWKNNKSLPFLRRGLRDSDSRVVIASAAGISSYKGKPIDLHKKSQTSRPPRNVSLMR